MLHCFELKALNKAIKVRPQKAVSSPGLATLALYGGVEAVEKLQKIVVF